MLQKLKTEGTSFEVFLQLVGVFIEDKTFMMFPSLTWQPHDPGLLDVVDWRGTLDLDRAISLCLPRIGIKETNQFLLVP